MDIWFESTGARLFAKGRGQGTPMVMLHGGMGTHAAASPFVSAMGEGYHVLLPDMRGCGASVCRDSTAFTWDLLADDIAALLDHVGAARAVVGGVSGGTGAALRFALKHPGRTLGVVLIQPVYAGAAAGYTPYQAGGFAPMAGLSARVAAQGVSAFDPMFAAAGMQAMAQAFLAAHDPQSVAAWGDFMARGDQPFGGLADLARIAAPVLIIPGADEMHPRDLAEQYRAALPEAAWFEPVAGDNAPTARAIAAFSKRVVG
jgi:3-oxoadipate enol-lactonase